MSFLDNPDYQRDAAEVKAAVTRNKVLCFDALAHFMRSPDMLPHSGYKSLEDALVKNVKRVLTDNEKLIRALERRWPDDED